MLFIDLIIIFYMNINKAWLGGIVDGNGYIGISKLGYATIEITVGIEDLKMVMYIKSVFGGSIKARSGSNSYRYRLCNKKGIIKFIDCINGHIHNSIRIVQFTKVCNLYNIKLSTSIIPDINNGYIAGLFDSDGTIGINSITTQLSVSISNKYKCNLIFLISIFGGSIYYDKGYKGYKWYISSKDDILKFIEYYYNIKAFRSNKSYRFLMVKRYYYYKSIKAYNIDSIYHKEWIKFIAKWNSYIKP